MVLKPHNHDKKFKRTFCAHTLIISWNVLFVGEWICVISNFQSYYSCHQDIVNGDIKPLLKLQFNGLYSLGYIPFQTKPYKVTFPIHVIYFYTIVANFRIPLTFWFLQKLLIPSTRQSTCRKPVMYFQLFSNLWTSITYIYIHISM